MALPAPPVLPTLVSRSFTNGNFQLQLASTTNTGFGLGWGVFSDRLLGRRFLGGGFGSGSFLAGFSLGRGLFADGFFDRGVGGLGRSHFLCDLFDRRSCSSRCGFFGLGRLCGALHTACGRIGGLGGDPLRITAYLGHEQSPLAYVTSVRSLVLRDDALLVFARLGVDAARV